uniref:Ras-GTPase-activating protein-binding protein n=1 Tax=Rhizophora mucronata TaxID=61149 RepID=A0A2P2IHT9_RHIMU
MSVPYPIPVTAAQVGTYFVRQYYQMLEQRPELIYQFFSDSSTMLRIDGPTRDSAASMLQIHALVMSLNYTGFEIRTAHALESWNRGVLVMVSGVAQLKNFNARRKFVETFFLAPQEKGFFVLNDVFQVIDEEPIHQHPAVFLAQNNLDSKVNIPAVPEPVPNYLLGGEIQAMDFVAPADAKESGTVDNYSFQEQPSRQVPDAESIIGESSMEEVHSSLQNATNAVQDNLPAPIEEPSGEPQKHTYASIVARGQSTPSAALQPNVNKSAPLTLGSEWNHPPQSTAQQAYMMSNSFERLDIAEEAPPVEDEDEIRSVYVRNLPPTVSEAEIGEEFKSFGNIAPDGVVIRSRKVYLVIYFSNTFTF